MLRLQLNNKVNKINNRVVEDRQILAPLPYTQTLVLLNNSNISSITIQIEVKVPKFVNPRLKLPKFQQTEKINLMIRNQRPSLSSILNNPNLMKPTVPLVIHTREKMSIHNTSSILNIHHNTQPAIVKTSHRINLQHNSNLIVRISNSKTLTKTLRTLTLRSIPISKKKRQE